MKFEISNTSSNNLFIIDNTYVSFMNFEKQYWSEYKDTQKNSFCINGQKVEEEVFLKEVLTIIGKLRTEKIKRKNESILNYFSEITKQEKNDIIIFLSALCKINCDPIFYVELINIIKDPKIAINGNIPFLLYIPNGAFCHLFGTYGKVSLSLFSNNTDLPKVSECHIDYDDFKTLVDEFMVYGADMLQDKYLTR